MDWCQVREVKSLTLLTGCELCPSLYVGCINLSVFEASCRLCTQLHRCSGRCSRTTAAHLTLKCASWLSGLVCCKCAHSGQCQACANLDATVCHISPECAHNLCACRHCIRPRME